MQRAHDPSGRLRFGVFEVDLRAGELAKRGQRIRLQEQPFQVLAMLLEKPGELVTREELQKKLWGQTVVDFDHGLNKTPPRSTTRSSFLLWIPIVSDSPAWAHHRSEHAGPAPG